MRPACSIAAEPVSELVAVDLVSRALRVTDRPRNIDDEEIVGPQTAKQFRQIAQVCKVDTQKVLYAPERINIDLERPVSILIVFDDLHAVTMTHSGGTEVFAGLRVNSIACSLAIG